MGGGGAWPGFEGKLHHTQRHKRRQCGGRRRVRRARAGFEIDHSEPKARVWRSRGRPGPTAPEHQRCHKQQNSKAWAPEGQAAEPVGGGGAWPGFETTRRAKLAARTARGRAAAHGHTKQPGHAAGPDGAQNTSGATSNKTARPGCRRARLRYPWAAAGPGRASRGSSTTHSDTSTAGAEGAGGSGGPGRASRSTTPSQRLVCGDLAGGRARRRPEHQRRHQQHRTPDAIGMEVTGGHTKQPGHAAGPDGARNTSGAAKQPGPDTRKPRPADAGRGQPTQSGGKV